MVKTVQEAYGEILRLRNLFYQKWQEVPHEVYDENRDAYKAKYEAFDKALELLTPSIVDPQPKESIEYNPFDDFRHTDSEETVSDDLKKYAEEWDESLYRSDAVIAGAKWHKQQMIKSAKLSGWVARDENGSLHLFEVEPSRIMHRWWDRDYHSTTLDNKDFPDLEWENEPVYVKLAIIKEDGR